jgi:hypothetical protein
MKGVESVFERTKAPAVVVQEEARQLVPILEDDRRVARERAVHGVAEEIGHVINQHMHGGREEIPWARGGGFQARRISAV